MAPEASQGPPVCLAWCLERWCVKWMQQLYVQQAANWCCTPSPPAGQSRQRAALCPTQSPEHTTLRQLLLKKKKKHFLTQNISIQNRISVSGFVWWSVHHFLRPKPELQIIMDNIHSAKATDMATISFQSLLYTSNVKLPSLVILSYTTHNLKVVTTLVQS